MKLVEKPEKPWRGKFVLVAPSSIKSKSYGKGWEGMGLKWIVDGIGVDKCGLMRNWCRLPFSRCQHMPTISQIYPIFQYVPICSNYFHISSIIVSQCLIYPYDSLWIPLNPIESIWYIRRLLIEEIPPLSLSIKSNKTTEKHENKTVKLVVLVAPYSIKSGFWHILAQDWEAWD